ncbi:xaa-Pro aminopeptidase 1-like [Amphiura filiformis]|uniref:xaa-Pro aminopeptidase 1-like n=1 Tax=Amphiura filiformis TaxID=82378 RepID=UPI003B2111E6
MAFRALHQQVLVLIILGILIVTSEPMPKKKGVSYVNSGKFRFKHDADISERELRDCDPTPTFLPPTTIKTDERLKNLRDLMASQNLAAFMVPSEDAHQSEYIAERDKRRKYISGLSGSAGLAIVTAEKAALWTDSRYWLQADMELDCNWLLMKSGEPDVPNSANWLVDNLNPGVYVGFDSRLMAVSTYDYYNSTFESAQNGGPVLVDVSTTTGNLVDTIWNADAENPQPSYPNKPLLIVNAEKYTGETWRQKIWQFPETESIRGQMSAKDADALVVTKLDEIAWIFNLRGEDVPYNPMFVSYAIITTDTIQLYLYDMNTRLTDEIRNHLGIGGPGCESNDGDECVTVKDYEDFIPDLISQSLTRDKIWISDTSSYAVYSNVPESKRLLEASPILLMKAVKSEKEIEGMNYVHYKDSIALCQLGAWMQETVDTLEDPINGDINVISELIVEAKATEFRSAQPDYRGLSFHTISGFGPHAAVIHYGSSKETDIPITKTSTFLFDSGSQYLDGSTDITRTFHFGTPTAFMIEAYTRVLIGHIDLALGVFAKGQIYGRDIDAFAREPLWRGGLDYKHGTGHGIGHFLNIHEAPININADYEGEEPIDLNVCVSDEPGYYQDGEFGIRIEDIMCSVEADTEHKFDDATYITWKMASLVPLEPPLIDFSMFTDRQLDWYNAYNQRIRTEIGSALLALDDNNDAYNWMMSKTKPITYKFSLGSSGYSKSHAKTVVIWLLVCAVVILAVSLIFIATKQYYSRQRLKNRGF